MDTCKEGISMFASDDVKLLKVQELVNSSMYALRLMFYARITFLFFLPPLLIEADSLSTTLDHLEALDFLKWLGCEAVYFPIRVI